MQVKILYIEDDPKSVRLVQKMLKIMDYEFVSANDGYSGLEVANSEKPDVILLDINLPDIDGYEVIRQLREKNIVDHNIRIIALTADPSNYEACQAAGFDGYLNKPITRGVLLRTISQFLSTM